MKLDLQIRICMPVCEVLKINMTIILKIEGLAVWIIYALASAFFAGSMSFLAKIGIKNTDSNLATALRTIVVVIFAWLMVFVVGSQYTITDISAKSLIFLVLSGLATGGSWLCYFRALQIGDVNKVVPVDKSSTVLTMLLSFLLLNEGLTWLKAVAMLLIGAGTYLMIDRKENSSAQQQGYKWLIYAIFSAVFASLTAILGKVGIAGVESNLGTAIRTIVVLVMAWLIVFIQGKHREIKAIDKRSWIFIVLSGLATGLSWLCFYRAIQDGAVSVVVPIDKLSILVTVVLSGVVLHERLSKKSATGLALFVAGTLSLLIKI
jgi:Predicted membrane protein